MKTEFVMSDSEEASLWPVRSSQIAVSKMQDTWLAGWIRELWNTSRSFYLRSRVQPVRELHIIEMLGLGGGRQLALVSCGCERFLVGCGSDQVHAIERVSSSAPSLLKPMEDA